MQRQALEWLYKQLKQKRIALCNAENKPNVKESEINDIRSSIDTIEWIIGEVLKGEEV